jgi:chromosome segregation ATPase
MSNRILFLALLLTMGSMAHANQLTDSIAKDTADLQTNQATLEKASSAGTEASQHYAHLANDVLPLLQGTKTRYEADVTAYNMDNAAVKSAIDAHNANRCMQDACAATYNAERDRLNAQVVEMQSRERLLDQRRDNLKTMYQHLSTDTDETFQKIKQARADYDQALAERKVLQNHLAVLKAESAGCKLLLRAQGYGSTEALKLKCGDVQFDGADASLPAPPPDPPSA